MLSTARALVQHLFSSLFPKGDSDHGGCEPRLRLYGCWTQLETRGRTRWSRSNLVPGSALLLAVQVPFLLELIAKSQLPSLSGVAQKNYMNILERVVHKVLKDQQNIRPIKELLQMLYVSLCGLVQDMGKSVLVGNINTWLYRMENILQWHQQLDNIQINRPSSTGMTLTGLPINLQLNIMQRLSDGRDLVSLGQVCPSLGGLAEDRLLWKRLCHHHFTDRQIRKRLMVSDKGLLEWKKMYSKLSRCYPHREQYSDTLHFCTHCHILFWKDTNHPCTANNPESCTMSLSPQDFINLFKF
ncbi:F-box only protein 32 isoform 2-T2 [Spinachia spinachia]